MRHLLVLIFILFAFAGQSQTLFEKADSLNKRRYWTVAGVDAIGTTSSLLILNKVWYSQYPRSSFQLFNDNDEWLQMDKVGHSLTSYYIGFANIRAMDWAGVDRSKAIWWGCMGLVYQTGLEVLDGFSANWGFSVGDMVANAAGTAVLIGQEYAWNEQRVLLKYSAHRTEFAAFRPNVLGSTPMEQLLKDYNGQTYWLSGNIYSFLKKDSKFPKWLNLAVGYSATGMISGTPNPDLYCDGSSWCENLDRHRQWYLSLDIDLTRLPLKSKFAKTVLGTFGFFKFPAPALQFSKTGVQLKPFYF